MTRRSSSGRPTLPADEKRSEIVAFKARKDEVRRIHAAADAAGMKIGAWVRKVTIAAAGRKPPVER